LRPVCGLLIIVANIETMLTECVFYRLPVLSMMGIGRIIKPMTNGILIKSRSFLYETEIFDYEKR